MIRRIATTCACSGNSSWNVEILLFVNCAIVSIKESGINKLKGSKESATECAALFGPASFVKCFFLEAFLNCRDYSLKLSPTLLENFMKHLNTQT